MGGERNEAQVATRLSSRPFPFALSLHCSLDRHCHHVEYWNMSSLPLSLLSKESCESLAVGTREAETIATSSFARPSSLLFCDSPGLSALSLYQNSFRPSFNFQEAVPEMTESRGNHREGERSRPRWNLAVTFSLPPFLFLQRPPSPFIPVWPSSTAWYLWSRSLP